MIGRAGRALLAVATAAASIAPAVPGGAATPVRTTPRYNLVSLGTTGRPAKGSSWLPSMSSDGRVVAFESTAGDLTADDATGSGNAGSQIYLRDLATMTTALASKNAAGAASNGGGYDARLSPDGRYLAFTAYDATNLTNPPSPTQEYLRDLQSGTVRALAGTQPAWSADGTTVAYLRPQTGGQHGTDVWVERVADGTATKISTGFSMPDPVRAEIDFQSPSLSADGNVVAFTAAYDDYRTGIKWSRVYVRDRAARTTTKASVPASGVPASTDIADFPHVSGDGTTVVFFSRGALTAGASGPGAYVRDLDAATTTRLPVPLDSVDLVQVRAISADARYVLFESDDPNVVAGAPDVQSGPWTDVFRYDRATGQSTKVSIAADGADEDSSSWAPAMSPDGRYVVFTTTAHDLGTPAAPNPADYQLVVRDLAPPALAISDATVREPDAGSVYARFTVTLSHPTIWRTDAAYAVKTATASAKDVATVPRTVFSLPSLGRSATIRTVVRGDGAEERDETYRVVLAPVGDARIAPAIVDALGIGTIVDNDPSAMSPQVNVQDQSVYEGDNGDRDVYLSIVLSRPATAAVTVNWATGTLRGPRAAGAADFAAASGSVRIAKGGQSAAVRVRIHGDTSRELDETLRVRLTAAKGVALGDGTAIVTIRDDD